ncbi:hypothetical protein P7B02_14370 [Caulobacter segnis]|uniref:hypothetical protein n=1 Tax=Caulobacter segnis TaxID=88688 RepID=UPI00240F2F04|nr:hypothetical protein [Caulobacter segnis]MDG2522720.1 hypothetical protein [Caulobacter segnis]
MKRRLSALMVLALLGLGACAHDRGEVVPGYSWIYLENQSEGAKLAYGLPNSDAVILMMTCKPGTKSVGLSLISGDKKPEFTLVSRKAQERVVGRSTPDMMSGARLIEASSRADGAALRSFERTGDLAVVNQGRRFNLKAGKNDRADVTQFFRSCGRA